jgi:hypothetical protein
MNNQMKSIELTDTEITLVDMALRKYWGRCKKLIDGHGVGHETLYQCNAVRNKLSSPAEPLTDGYYEVINGEIKPLEMFNGGKVLHCNNYSLKAGLK